MLPACAAPPPRSQPPPPEPPALVSTLEIPGDFVLRQQVAFRTGERSGSFEAVVQKHCDELVVVGLTPFGSRAFSILQRGTEVDVETHAPGAWPFPPEYILLDIHRAYLVPLPEVPPSDAVREARYGAERLTERWESGRLQERRFRSAEGGVSPAVVIRYVGGETHEHTVREIRIENGEFGYELVVRTLSRVELGCP